MASFAIQNAQQLNEIGFPEFTTKLITDIFDAILKSNIQQLEAYAELVKKLSLNLTDFINDTQDTIDAEEMLDFLGTAGITDSTLEALSQADDRTAPLSSLNTVNADGTPGAALTDADVDPLTAATSSPSNSYATTNIVAATTVDDLRKAVAKRISESKYDMLQTMTRIGLIRTYPKSGHIKTKLLFNTYDYSQYVKNVSRSKVESKGFNARIGGSLTKILGKSKGSLNLSGGIGYGWSKVTVKTVNENTFKNSGTNIDILGEVVLNIETDVLPLSSLE